VGKKVVALEALGIALTPESRVDAAEGVIYGAKILGKESRNKRRYPADVVKRRHKVYEGAQCYANHDYAQLKTGKARPLQDWGGVLRDVEERHGEAFGDLHCLKETPAGRIILEAAQRCPDRFGLSPMHLIESEKGADGVEVVSDILECWSVDAVTRPATTRTLFEEEQSMADDAMAPAAAAPAATTAAPGLLDAFAALAAAIVADADLDDTERGDAVKKLMKFKADLLGGGEEEAPAEGEAPAEAAPAEEAHRRPAPVRTRLDRIEDGQRRMAIRLMAGESLPVDEDLMQVLLASCRTTPLGPGTWRRSARPGPPGGRPPGRPGPPGRRTVAAEEEQRGAGNSGAGNSGDVPMLTAGADPEAVRKYWAGR
jgi:hypothetical protein